MLQQSKLIAFVGSQNPAKARDFYAGVLGLTLVDDEAFALVFDAHGTMLRVSKVPTHTPANFTVLGWQVPDIAAAVRALTERGVAFERYDGFQQDDLGVQRFPDGTQVAWFKDPDGNTLSLTQFP